MLNNTLVFYFIAIKGSFAKLANVKQVDNVATLCLIAYEDDIEVMWDKQANIFFQKKGHSIKILHCSKIKTNLFFIAIE